MAKNKRKNNRKSNKTIRTNTSSINGNQRTDQNRKKSRLSLSLIIGIVSLIVTIVGVLITVGIQMWSDQTYMALADRKYNEGMDIYNKHSASDACDLFQESIDAREKAHDINSIELADAYKMLGVSKIYANFSYSASNDAVAALDSARRMYKTNGEEYEVALCDFYIGTAYFEKGYDQLDIAQKYAEESLAIMEPLCGEDNQFAQRNDISDTYDYEIIYNSCQYYYLISHIYNLMGKVNTRENDYGDAFKYFNLALLNCSYLFENERILADCNLSEIENIKNDEIRSNIVNAIAFAQTDNGISTYLYTESEIELLDEKKYFLKQPGTIIIPTSKDIATFLTNRGMSEYGLGYAEMTTEDCQNALSIWKQYEGEEQVDNITHDNTAYTYIYLALAMMGTPDNMPDPIEMGEKSDEMLEYANLAISSSKKDYGRDHPNTAFMHESKGVILVSLGEYEEALDSYYDAYIIYDEIDYKDDKKFIKENMRSIYGNLETDQSFDEWFSLHKL